MVCRHIKLCRSFELLPLKGKGGVDFTAVGTLIMTRENEIGPIRLCRKGNFPTKDKMAGPEVGPLIKDPLHNSLTKDTLQWTTIHNSDKRATSLRGTKWLPPTCPLFRGSTVLCMLLY